MLAAAAEDGSVVAVDPRDLHVLAPRKPVHAGRIGGLAWLPSSAGAPRLLSAGWDQCLVRSAIGGA